MEKQFVTRAILVDDDKDVQEVFSEYISIYDIEILGIGNDGKEASKLYKELKPDLVFMDVLMPKYDGVYGLKKIRECDPDAKVIFITASISAGTQKKLVDLKASAIIWKPFEMNYLLKTIERVKNGESVIVPQRNA